jgi:hypothetical protein
MGIGAIDEYGEGSRTDSGSHCASHSFYIRYLKKSKSRRSEANERKIQKKLSAALLADRMCTHRRYRGRRWALRACWSRHGWRERERERPLPLPPLSSVHETEIARVAVRLALQCRSGRPADRLGMFPPAPLAPAPVAGRAVVWTPETTASATELCRVLRPCCDRLASHHVARRVEVHPNGARVAVR